MTCPHCHHPAPVRNAAKGKRPRPRQIDPTATGALRRAAVAELDRRWARFAGEVEAWIREHLVTTAPTEILLNYDPNQPRDEAGRWTSGPGGFPRSRLEAAARMAREEFIANPPEGFRYREGMHEEANANDPDHITVGQKFFDLDPASRVDVLLHERAHYRFDTLTTEDQISIIAFSSEGGFRGEFPAETVKIGGMSFNQPARSVEGINGQTTPFENMVEAMSMIGGAEEAWLKERYPKAYQMAKAIVETGKPLVRGRGDSVTLEKPDLKTLAASETPVIEAARYIFRQDPALLEQFIEWVNAAARRTLLALPAVTALRSAGGRLLPALPKDPVSWVRTYLDGAFRQGVRRGAQDVIRVKAGLKRAGRVLPRAAEGMARELIGGNLALPVGANKVAMLATRAYSDLKGVSDQLASNLGRTLAQGMADGKNPLEVARQISIETGMARNRSRTIARTEIIRAHAEGKLDTFDALGLEGVEVLAEWSTAGDDKVCPLCRPLEGKVFSLAEARGMLPRHPNCRCTWVPSVQLARGTK